MGSGAGSVISLTVSAWRKLREWSRAWMDGVSSGALDLRRGKEKGCVGSR